MTLTDTDLDMLGPRPGRRVRVKRPGTLCRLLASLNSMDGKDGLTSLRLPGLMAGAVCKGAMLGIAVAEENEHLEGHLESIASWFLQMVMAEFGPELQVELAAVQERTASQAEDYTVHTMAASPGQQDGNQLSAALDAKVGKFLEGCLHRTFPLERYFVNMDHWPATILGIRLLCRSDEEEGEVQVPWSRTRVQVFGQRKDGKDFPTASGPVGTLLLKVLKREASLLFAKHYGFDRGVAYSQDTEPLGSKCSMVIFHDFEPMLFVYLVPVQCISHQSVLALYVRAQEGDNEEIMSDLLQEQLNAISKRTDSFSSIRSDRADSNYSVMHRKPIPPEIHFIEQEKDDDTLASVLVNYRRAELEIEDVVAELVKEGMSVETLLESGTGPRVVELLRAGGARTAMGMK